MLVLTIGVIRRPAVVFGSVMLNSIGAIVLFDSFVLDGTPIPSFHFRPLIFILISSLAFAYLLKPLGLVLSLAVLVGIGAFGGFEFRSKEVAILYVVLAIFSVLVFVKGLGLPIPVWPGE